MEESILITGGSGLIGYELINHYLNNTQKNIYQIIREDNENNFYGTEKIKADLNDLSFTDKLPSSIDTIIHLAQSEHYKLFPEFSNDIYNVNIKSTFQLIEYARKNNCKKFFYASSGSVYDNSILNNIPINENSILKKQPLDLYTASKLASENILSPYSKFVNIIIGRIFFPYGLRQKKNMFIPRIIEMVNNNEQITINGAKGLIFHPTSAQFISFCIFNLLENDKKGIFNIASSNNISLNEYVKLISKILNKDPNIKFDEPKNNQNFTVNTDYLDRNLDKIYDDNLTKFIKDYKYEFLQK